MRAGIGARIRAARTTWRWFDHAASAYTRYNEVQGGLLAAAITYYGFLSFFPLLALAFAVVGYISGAYPDAQDAVTQAVQDGFPSLIGSGPGQINIQDVIDAKAGAGVIGLVGLFYAGLGWLDALRAALRRVFGTSDVPLVFVKKKAVDVVVLIGLGLALLASLFVTGVTGRRGTNRRVAKMIVERIEAVERDTDARDAAKHAETAFRRMGPSAALGERPPSRDLRRFEVMLVRRIVTG